MTDIRVARSGWSSRFKLFLKERVGRRNEEGLWFALAVALGAATAITFLFKAFAHSMSIQDDGRMFLSWMGRWDDPTLLQGDLVADYWQSVTPWFYTALFRAAWWVGVEPSLFIKFFPAVLYVLLAVFAFRFVRAMGAEPVVAFVATALVVQALARADIVLSGTPRAFWPILLLATLDGLARRRIWQTAVAQLLMTGTYPHMAVVDALVIGLSFIVPARRPRLELGPRQLALVGISALVTVAGLLPFLLKGDDFGPAVTLTEARHIATFLPGGRGQVFEADGTLDLLCGQRTGLLGSGCDGAMDPKFWLLAALTLFGPVLLFVRRPAASGGMRSPLPLYLLLASGLMFAVAAALAFRLHLPNRFSAALPLVPWLTTVPLLVEQVRRPKLLRWLLARPFGPALLAAVTVVTVVAAFGGAVDMRREFRTPAEPNLISAIAALPKDAVVGGFVRDLDFSPVFTNRSTLFSQELTIAYQFGYFRPVMARMTVLRDAVLTANPQVLAERLTAEQIDWLLVEDETLRERRIPAAFRGFFGPALDALEVSARDAGPSALARFSPGCTRAVFGTVSMLDAACLVRAAERST